MKTILITLLLLSSGCLSAAITTATIGGRFTIRITGSESGDDLRTFVDNNASTGTVTERDIIFSADLRVQGTLTDNNAVYHFPNSRRFAPQNGSTVNFTDLTIHYTGTQKNHSFNSAYTANFTRVFYLQGVTSGRSDFFNNGNYSFNMSDVTMVSYGASDYLHFQTANTLYNITIVNANGGLNFEPGARNNGEIEIIHNLKLDGVTQIVGGSGANGDFKTYEMNWTATNWNMNQRNVDFFFVNPTKPIGWTGYSGSANKVKEYYTHDVNIKDLEGNNLNGIDIMLYNNNGSIFEYQTSTNVSGDITQEEILKIDNSVSLNHDRGNFTVVVADYDYRYYTKVNPMDKPAIDNLVAIDDQFVTLDEASAASIAGISINHNSQTITISSPVSLCDLYDFIKYDKVNNNIEEPNITTLAATPTTSAGVSSLSTNYQLILASGSKLSPCSKFEKFESTQISNIDDPSANIEIGLTDPNGTYKLIRLIALDSANVEIKNSDNSNVLLQTTNSSGNLNSVIPPGSATNVSISVDRDEYSTWATDIDLLSAGDVYSYVVVQSKNVDDPCSLDNQELELFLIQKIVSKNQLVQTSIAGSVDPNITLNNIVQASATKCSKERQEEMIVLLKKILAKTQSIKEQLNSE